MNKSSRKILIVLSTLNLVIVGVIFFVVFLIFNKQQNLLELKNQLQIETKKLESMQSLNSLVSDTKEDRTYLDSVFVNKEGIIDFLDKIESLGFISGTKVKIVSVSEDKDKDAGSFSKIRFEATGTWAGISKFVALLDHVPNPILIMGMQISKGISEDGRPWQISVDSRVLKTPQ